jgi:hypothetical protein
MATLAIFRPRRNQVKILVAPFLIAAHRYLRRFHQQEAQ